MSSIFGRRQAASASTVGGASPPARLMLTCLVAMAAFFVPAAVAAAAEFPLTVQTEGSGEGTITSSPAGIDCGAECTAEFEEEETVTLTATPATGSEFYEWGGDCIGQVECEVTMDEARSVTAVFELEEIGLSTFTEGGGFGEIECEVEGGPAEECEFSYPFGTEITFVATPDPGSEFIEWGEDCTGSGVCELTLDGEKSVTAVFAQLFTLEVEKEGTGSGTVASSPPGINCGTECETKFTEGETVILTASPSAGSVFAGWTGCEEEEGAECEVMIGEDATVTATFNLAPPSEFALTVSLAGAGKGAVTSSPAGINCGIDCSEAYAAGTEVTLTATPASGSAFAGWSGACTGTGTCKVTMSQARSVTATFEKAPTPPPAAGTVVVARTAKVKGGKAQLKLTCTGKGLCKGKLKLTAKIKSGGKLKNMTIGKASFSLAAGAKKVLKVRLSAPAKQALAKGPLKAKVGGSGVVASKVKLKLAK